jgi:NAD(P)-dependent dehydrogenase (short-subunit alcohol dehydrogenase family)
VSTCQQASGPVLRQSPNFDTWGLANSIPGFIETEMISTVPEKIRTKLLEQIPMRHFGRAEEIARACVYLCSTDGDYITDTELSINGGLYR